MNQKAEKQFADDYAELIVTLGAALDLAKICRPGDESRRDALVKLIEHVHILAYGINNNFELIVEKASA